jgi:hypothetical protein
MTTQKHAQSAGFSRVISINYKGLFAVVKRPEPAPSEGAKNGCH